MREHCRHAHDMVENCTISLSTPMCLNEGCSQQHDDNRHKYMMHTWQDTSNCNDVLQK